MPWTQASEPTGTWSGQCNQTDLFTITVPTEPDDFSPPSSVSTDHLHLLDGFEYPSAYYGSGDTTFWAVSATGTPFSIVSGRDAELTGGNALQVVATSAAGGALQSVRKPISCDWEYFRIYLKIASYTNGNGSLRTPVLAGWTDSTGNRSFVGLSFPANGSVPKFYTGSAVPGASTVTTGSVSISTGVWYRIEIVTERLTSTMTTTCNIYVGDTDTVFETITNSSTTIAMGGFPFVGVPILNTGNALTVVFDDLRVQTATPLSIPSVASNSPKYGPGGIWCLYPLEADTSTWTPLSGENYANVDEFPVGSIDGDTSYVEDTGTTSKTDTYDVAVHPDTLPNNMYIKAVQTRCQYKLASGSPTMRVVYVDGLGNSYLGLSDVAGSSYEVTSDLFLMYEDGLRTELNSVQKIGINHVAGSSSGLRCTASWGLIDVAEEV